MEKAITCSCPKPDKMGHVSECKFVTPTNVWWGKNLSCYAWRCSNPLMLTDPPNWAYGNSRRATVGDVISGALIENANYIAVRSCYCKCSRCKHFTLPDSDTKN